MNKKLSDILHYVFFFSALFLMALTIYLRRNGGVETANVLENIVLALLLAAAIFRWADKLFPKWFGHKPTREEIEKRMFDKDEN